jgi:hypothetical protein
VVIPVPHHPSINPLIDLSAFPGIRLRKTQLPSPQEIPQDVHQRFALGVRKQKESAFGTIAGVRSTLTSGRVLR